MGILTKKMLVDNFSQGKLIRDARKINGQYDIEAASYDLSIGIAVCKKHNKKLFQKRHEIATFDPTASIEAQKTITLGPGQMVFVITQEEIVMPDNMCGVVYSRNSLALNGILALNAGHIDPSYTGPITIKLINLRAIDCTLRMGDPIFTIVFQTLEKEQNNQFESNPRTITKQEILKRVTEATDISLDNALYDLALLREFVKENEFGRAVWKWVSKSFWGMTTFIVTSILWLISAYMSVQKLLELLKK